MRVRRYMHEHGVQQEALRAVALASYHHAQANPRVVMALAEHGFYQPGQANDFLTFENLIAPSGRLPLNTSGGNLAECYLHGFELVLEAVRQVRGVSTSQVKRNDVAMVIGGPMVTPVSNLLLGSEATL